MPSRRDRQRMDTLTWMLCDSQQPVSLVSPVGLPGFLSSHSSHRTSLLSLIERLGQICLCVHVFVSVLNAFSKKQKKKPNKKKIAIKRGSGTINLFITGVICRHSIGLSEASIPAHLTIKLIIPSKVTKERGTLEHGHTEKHTQRPTD